MAEKIFVKRNRLGGFIPADARSEEAIKQLPFDTWITAQISQPRNGKHHAKYWSLLSKVYQNQSYFATVDDLHLCIKVATGHSTTYQLKDGRLVHCPTSISFAKMDQREFEKYYDKVLGFIAEQVIPGIKKEELKAELEGYDE